MTVHKAEHGVASCAMAERNEARCPSGDRRDPSFRDGSLARAVMARREALVQELCLSYQLSDRQADVVLGAISGMSSKEIAAKFDLDYRTVGQHLARAYSKCGVRDRNSLLCAVVDALLRRVSSPPT